MIKGNLISQMRGFVRNGNKWSIGIKHNGKIELLKRASRNENQIKFNIFLEQRVVKCAIIETLNISQQHLNSSELKQ